MRFRFSRSLTAMIALVSILALTTLASAQQPIRSSPTVVPSNPAPAADQPTPAGQPVVRSHISDDLTQLIVAGNRNEIDMSRFGQDRAQNQQVRDFAKDMVTEHQDFVNKLQQAAANANPANATPAAPGFAPVPVAPAGTAQSASTQLLRVLEQIGSRHLTLIQNELSSKQGIEFDQAFMGNELAAHFAMLAQLQVAADHTSGSVQQVVNQGIQVTQHHIDRARGIMGQLEQARVQQASKPEETQKR